MTKYQRLLANGVDVMRNAILEQINQDRDKIIVFIRGFVRAASPNNEACACTSRR